MSTATAFMALFVWASDGLPQPILAFNDSEACWAVVEDNKARGIASECRVAYLISPIGAAPAVVPMHSPRPMPKPWVRK